MNEKVYFIVRPGEGWLGIGREVHLKGMEMIRKGLGKGFENAGKAWKRLRNA